MIIWLEANLNAPCRPLQTERRHSTKQRAVADVENFGRLKYANADLILLSTWVRADQKEGVNNKPARSNSVQSIADIIAFESSRILTNLPKRDELLLREVLALPKASSTGLERRIFSASFFTPGNAAGQSSSADESFFELDMQAHGENKSA
eukprot:6172548-Pleurochrysis_carterae.AAC.1